MPFAKSTLFKMKEANGVFFFMEMFEETATPFKWSMEEWTVHLLPLLKGWPSSTNGQSRCQHGLPVAKGEKIGEAVPNAGWVQPEVYPELCGSNQSPD